MCQAPPHRWKPETALLSRASWLGCSTRVWFLLLFMGQCCWGNVSGSHIKCSRAPAHVHVYRGAFQDFSRRQCCVCAVTASSAEVCSGDPWAQPAEPEPPSHGPAGLTRRSTVSTQRIINQYSPRFLDRFPGLGGIGHHLAQCGFTLQLTPQLSISSRAEVTLS